MTITLQQQTTESVNSFNSNITNNNEMDTTTSTVISKSRQLYKSPPPSSNSSSSSGDESPTNSLEPQQQKQQQQNPTQQPDNSSMMKNIKSAMDSRYHFNSKSSGLQISVLGVPLNNAKSRVETQIKLCIQLLTENGDKPNMELSYLTLPDQMVSPEKAKKQVLARGDIDEASYPSMLYLDAKVVCASNIEKSVATCDGCMEREKKRIKKSKYEDIQGSVLAKDAHNMILFFNCPKYLDFTSGDTFIPTRITCYCRHHSEKIGFCVYYMLKNSNHEIIATGVSPPIQITDDHKSSRPKPLRKKSLKGTAKSTSSAKSSSKSLVDVNMQEKANSIVTSPRQLSLDDTLTDQLLPTTSSSTQQASEPKSSSSSAAAAVDVVSMMDLMHEPFHITTDLFNVSNSPISTPYLSPESTLETPIASLVTPTISGSTTPQQYSSDIGLLHQRKRQRSIGEIIDSQLGSGIYEFPISPASAEKEPTNNTGVSFTSFNIQHTSSNSTNLNMQSSGSIVSPSTASSVQLSQSVPSISKVIPGEGPLQGGLEVTVLGNEFYDGLTVYFGESPAVTTFWSCNTLVCILPPSAIPGSVPVSSKTTDQNSTTTPPTLQYPSALFTYKDDTEKGLLELALQVIGMRMSGKIQDPRKIAMNIVNETSQNQSSVQQVQDMIQHYANVIAAGSSENLETRNQKINTSSITNRGFTTADTTTSTNSDSLVIEELLVKVLSSLPLESNLSISNKRGGHTLLTFASLAGMPRLVEFLITRIRKGVLDYQDVNGYTALHFSALRGNYFVSSLLIRAGADVKLLTKGGSSCVQVAPKGTCFVMEKLINGVSIFDIGGIEIKDGFVDVGSSDTRTTIEPKEESGLIPGSSREVKLVKTDVATVVGGGDDDSSKAVTLTQTPPLAPQYFVWPFQTPVPPQQQQQQIDTFNSTALRRRRQTSHSNVPTPEHNNLGPEPPGPFMRFFNYIRPSSAESRVCECKRCSRCREKLARHLILNQNKSITSTTTTTNPTLNRKHRDPLYISYWGPILLGLFILGLVHYLMREFEVEAFIKSFVNVGDLRKYFATARPGQAAFAGAAGFG